MVDDSSLFEWCAARSKWQQEAVRLLATKAKLDESELRQLEVAVRAEAGFAVGKAAAWPALSKAHLKAGNKFAPITVLGSIGPLRNIDRLAAQQPPLKFAINGVTLIYGPNGSGKSGYCRIAKKVCHCLHDVTLRGNVFEPASTDPREITLTFRVDGDKTRTVIWDDRTDPPSELGRISVFDSDVAGLYVDAERNIEFLPFELALLTNLAEALRILDSRFRAEEAQLNKAHKTPLPLGYEKNTKVSAMLANLRADEHLPAEAAMRSLAAWTDKDDAELQAIKLELSQDPALLSKVKQATKGTVETLVVEANTIFDTIGNAGVGRLKDAQAKAATMRDAAKAAAAAFSEASAVPQLGNETWRQMLTYARDFAAEAYPTLSKPQLVAADICVLCHQPLDGEARLRLAAFDKYVEGRANADAEQAKKLFADIARAVLDVKFTNGPEIKNRLVNFVERSAHRQGQADRLEQFYATAQERHDLLSKAIKAVDYTGLDGLADLDRSVIDELVAESATLAKEIEGLKPAAGEAAKRAERQQKLDNLEARKKLSTDIETFVARRNSLEVLVKTKACIAACSVATITSHITRLRRKVLTDSLQSSLHDEIVAFDLQHLPLKLADRGEVGKSKVHIGLEAQQKIGKNSDILSEGEKRALALAGFLAELKEVGAKHGIVVDDPVSSLDHGRTDAVAKRLVKEAAAGRQVIIFTHNLFFHHAVVEAAQEMKVRVREEWIAKHGDGRFGIIDDNQRPWISMGVSKRLSLITELLQKKKATYSESDETQRSFVIELYTKMRETWEHSIEEILFAGVVGRFRPNVSTMKLRAARIEKADYESVYAGMTRCSKFSGHDQSIGVPVDLPKWDTIKADLDSLATFISVADRRRRALEDEGKAFEKGPMAADILE
ncbi:AAA family ATPase [Bradyrhizobium sp. JYMT SZCCT0428]|uniref:AAA family ATPase n=1 Tax=Bradyrhizobium sp. JYMT SZCCT0428 TaxID=2807673 RepID=UPI001BAAB234|nr:AAA family ATPase [Bradyrhizobium sp. JYMT SZCCT0428]MBR1153968.1 AAA family ATPase [Bradyrhizobium sp. JYMT SZCCT0428]